MTISPDGSKLYPLLEGALWDGEQFENVDGKRYLRVLEFDTKQQALDWSQLAVRAGRQPERHRRLQYDR